MATPNPPPSPPQGSPHMGPPNMGPPNGNNNNNNNNSNNNVAPNNGPPQTSPPAPAPTADLIAKTQPSTKLTHIVAVGKTEFTFEPNNLVAGVGDMINLEFYTSNYSAIRSTWDFPCSPIGDSNNSVVWSGWQPVEQGSPHKSYSFAVNDTQPIFFYGASISENRACNEKGMVLIINPGSFAVDEYKTRAQNAPRTEIPYSNLRSNLFSGDDDEDNGRPRRRPPPPWGGGRPPWDDPNGNWRNNSSNNAALQPSPSAVASMSSHSLHPGIIAGIALGSVALLAVILFIMYLFIRLHHREKQRDKLAVDGPSFQHFFSHTEPHIGMGAAGHRSSNNISLPPAPGHEMQLPRNTIIIPLTDQEKERYLERAAVMQGRGSGLTMHADSSGNLVSNNEPMGTANQCRESSLPGDFVPPIPPHARTREQRLEDELGTPRSPAEM